MKEPSQVLEIFLQPGEFYFGNRDTRIRTQLGSCVAITLWHPARKIGGMCHYRLPTWGKALADALEGQYADEVMQLFLGEIAAAGTLPSEYEVKLFGGGEVFSGVERGADRVPARHLEAGRSLATRYGFRIKIEDPGGGTGPRNLIFDIWNGNVWVRKFKDPAPTTAGNLRVPLRSGHDR
jgi:chemotaxis protein CheD